MKYIAFRNLIGVSHTEAEAKAEAEAIQVSCLILLDKEGCNSKSRRLFSL